MSRTLLDAESELARTRFINLLMTRGCTAHAAEHIASKATFGPTGDGDTFTFLNDVRALYREPASIERLVAHALEHFPIHTEAPATGTGAYDPVAAGHAMAAEQKKQSEGQKLAFQ